MVPSNLRSAFIAHDHLLTYEQVLLHGISPKELRLLMRAGAVVRVRHGVYADGGHWRTAASHAGRGLLAARAASLMMVEPHVLSHDSAAHALGLDFVTPDVPLVHVTRAGVRGGRTTSGVKHHGAPYRPGQVLETAVGKVLAPARTAVDLVREHGMRVGLGACDSALRLGTARFQLVDAAAPMTSWRGVRTVRLAVEWADGGAENPGESLARLLVLETGLGRPVTQFPVLVEGRVVWCDLLVGAHVVEFDGQLKYRNRSDGGVADRDPGEVAWAERRRERKLIEQGLGVSRLVWSDLLPERWDATRVRLAREIRSTHEAGGALVPPRLRAFADRMDGERAARIRRGARSA